MLEITQDALISGLAIGRGGSSGTTNTAIGKEVLEINSSGAQNTAIGAIAMKSNLTGSFNSASGYSALQSNTTGNFNTAAGNQALSLNETGSYNTAIGSGALYFNKGRSRSTAIGYLAMGNAFNGADAVDSYNTAVGYEALRGHAIPGYNSGQYNTAMGDMALRSNREGSYNTATGQGALYNNTFGNSNTANGNNSLHQNTTGSYNFAGGHEALNKSTGGNANVAIGYRAGREITTGSNNILLGYYAGNNITTGHNNIVIGNEIGAPLPGGNSQIVIGASDLLYGDLINKRIGIGTAAPKSAAILDLESTNKGFLPPRMTTQQRNAISTPVEGLTIYNTDISSLEWFTGEGWFTAAKNVQTGKVTDVDGNTYVTVKIGSQWWMAENLKTTKYRNNTPIENPTGNTAWQNNLTGAYAWYNNTIGNKNLYGALYNWHAVNNPNGLCPLGWHVPTDAEWTTLIAYIDPGAIPDPGDYIQSTSAGGKLKSMRTSPDSHPRWDSPNLGASDFYYFSGLPGGYRYANGTFEFLGTNGLWWSSTEIPTSVALVRYMVSSLGSVYRNFDLKTVGFSVRCIRD
jgi:uncharacterized protein (TIGR02145 family)